VGTASRATPAPSGLPAAPKPCARLAHSALVVPAPAAPAPRATTATWGARRRGRAWRRAQLAPLARAAPLPPPAVGTAPQGTLARPGRRPRPRTVVPRAGTASQAPQRARPAPEEPSVPPPRCPPRPAAGTARVVTRAWRGLRLPRRPCVPPASTPCPGPRRAPTAPLAPMVPPQASAWPRAAGSARRAITGRLLARHPRPAPGSAAQAGGAPPAR
jgi:hypothetical protein